VSYRATIPQDLPPYPQIEFDAPGGLGDVALHVLLEVEGQTPWVGVFRCLGYSDVNEIFTWPDGQMLLVVARGYGHYFPVAEPQSRTELPVFPIRHALRYSSGLVVLGGFDRLCGLDGHSIQWVSSLVASDWLDDVRLEGGSSPVAGTYRLLAAGSRSAFLWLTGQRRPRGIQICENPDRTIGA
jgi:hypothetical protein